jgi:hypothetical protein
LQWNTSQLYTTGTLSIVSAGLPGDFNLNGIVDTADYVVWRNGLGTTYTQTDYDTWRSNFGRSAAAGATDDSLLASIPEPATFSLLLLVTPALHPQCRSRRRSSDSFTSAPQ